MSFRTIIARDLAIGVKGGLFEKLAFKLRCEKLVIRDVGVGQGHGASDRGKSP